MLRQIIRRLFARTPKEWEKTSTPWSDRLHEHWCDQLHESYTDDTTMSKAYAELNLERWRERKETLLAEPLRLEVMFQPKSHIPFDEEGMPIIIRPKAEIKAYDKDMFYRGRCVSNCDKEWFLHDERQAATGLYFDSLAHLMSTYNALGFVFHYSD